MRRCSHRGTGVSGLRLRAGRPGVRAGHDINIDRTLASVLFTDIVGSTDLTMRIGDKESRRLLARNLVVVGAPYRLMPGKMNRGASPPPDGVVSREGIEPSTY
jgi:class 3 adenylate cyclase